MRAHDLVLIAAAMLSTCSGERSTLVVGLDGAPVALDPYHQGDNLTWSLLSNFYDCQMSFS